MTDLSDLTELFRKFGLSTLIVILTIIILGSLFFVSPTIASKEGMNARPKPMEQNAGFWNVHLYAIPGADATTLNVAVENIGNSCQGDIEFIAQYQGSSPTPVKGLEDPGHDRYVAVIPNFFPGCASLPCTAIEAGTLEVTCDQPQLASRTVNFRRYYAPSGLEETIISTDNNAQLNTFATSLSAGHYVIVMPTNAAPGTPPSGVTLISESYTFRPSGLLNFSDENMSVSLDYRTESLGGADPLTVRVYEWDLVGREWLDVGEQTNFITGGPRFAISWSRLAD